MFQRKRPRRDERLDQVRWELLMAVKASNEELEAADDSPDLYEGVQMRIAAERGRRTAERTSADRRGLSFIPALLTPNHSPSWILTAPAVLLLVAGALLLWLPRQSHETTPIKQPLTSQVAPIPVDPTPAPYAVPKELTGGSSAPVLVASPTVHSGSRRTSGRRGQSENPTSEIATDFLPLTFTAESTGPESGHLVRVTIPRSALVAMGLPMNAERAGELVRADVFIGDDGLARAIRFIQ